MARIRIPAGYLTVSQAEVLADAAESLGDGHLDITSRGNVQLRGLAGGCGRELADVLDGAGLLPSPSHERVRNIVASPLSGLDGNGHADVQPWVRELDRLLCADGNATALSGRFLFGLDDGRGDITTLRADVMLIAEPDGSAVLRVAGDPTALRLRAEDGPRAALVAAGAFLDAARDSGTRAWRVRELPPEHALLARDVAARLAAAGIACVPAEQPLPEGAPPAPGLVEGPGGRSALSVLAPLGRLTAAQWRQLAEGAGELRVTPWRGVVVADPGADAAVGLVTDPASPWVGVGACTGRPGCAKSLSDVRSDAAATVGSGRGGLPVYWSGCERRCGHPHGTWVDVVATGAGYDISVLGEPVRTGVTAAELAGAIAAARATTATR
ncbi:precorrin-3B synthase [Streptomyces sannanensis]|uniref:Precorrin-3B synthase n=1 Tax=Streptomyces sannanensis TaxID=285536 RepID=A0ABP6S8B8_9ACTN